MSWTQGFQHQNDIFSHPTGAYPSSQRQICMWLSSVGVSYSCISMCGVSFFKILKCVATNISTHDVLTYLTHATQNWQFSFSANIDVVILNAFFLHSHAINWCFFSETCHVWHFNMYQHDHIDQTVIIYHIPVQSHKDNNIIY